VSAVDSEGDNRKFANRQDHTKGLRSVKILFSKSSGQQTLAAFVTAASHLEMNDMRQR
jgi:hypothetical protein